MKILKINLSVMEIRIFKVENKKYIIYLKYLKIKFRINKRGMLISTFKYNLLLLLIIFNLIFNDLELLI